MENQESLSRKCRIFGAEACLQALLQVLELKDRGHSKTFMLGLESLAYLEHRTGLPCKMMIGIAVPHEDDPGMESLPSIFSLNP